MACNTGLLHAQVRYVSPLDIQVQFAGNFGEPRPNHFHCGLDFRTQGVIGKKIYAVASGYISRATVGLDGFGNALYVTHHDGNTSVYCHLDRFLEPVARRVFARQIAEEREVVDVHFSPDDFPVRAGQQIAVSGNTGASAGPHLHLEIHRTCDGALLNPMPYFKHLVSDKRPPKVHAIRVYPMPGEGVVDGSDKPVTFVPGDAPKTIKAWGRIGLAYWADDYMTNSHNKFGIYQVSLKIDGREIYATKMDSLMPSDHRKINSWGDYAWFIEHKNWYLKGFADPGNDLSLLKMDGNRGVLQIDQERTYKAEYHFTDEFGNTTVCRFDIEGAPYVQTLAKFRQKEEMKRRERHYLKWNQAHVVQMPGMELRLPSGLLFRDVLLEPEMQQDENHVSYKYCLHKEPVPLKANATLMIALSDSGVRTDKCYLESNKGYIGGTYQNGWVTASVRYLHDTYALSVDTLAPQVTPLAQNKWKQTRKMRIKCYDSGSGIKSVKAYVDGRFVLFTGKQARVCDMSLNGLRPENRMRKLVVLSEDRCGNIAQDTIRFIY